MLTSSISDQLFWSLRKIFEKRNREHSPYIESSILSNDTNGITVILNVWKRNYLEEQINALLNQSNPMRYGCLSVATILI